MEENSSKNLCDERTNESLEEITELSLGDEPWNELFDTSIESKWNCEMPLSEELRKLDEEQKQQIAEARAWVEEEEAMDEMLRKDIAELQLAKQKIHDDTLEELMHKDIPDLHISKQNTEITSSADTVELPPEVEKKIADLENKVKTLQSQLDEKTEKVAHVSDLYTELLNKLNESRERSLATDKEFKASFTKIKKDYAEVEALLKSEIERYKTAAKQMEFKLTEKEIEVSELKQEREELQKSKSDLETKYNESAASIETLNKHVLKLKVQLKNIKTERDSLKKEIVNVEDIELIKERLSQIEEERNALLKEKENAEDLATLRDRIALLEEEKGNLQLQVIDLDEMKEAVSLSQKQYADLENSFADLKNSATILENENQRIISNYENAEAKIKEQQKIIDRFLKSAQESEEQKIIAVMRSVELEEQLSFRDNEISQLKEDFTKLDNPVEDSSSNIILEAKSINALQSSNDILSEKLKLLQEEKDSNSQFIGDLRDQLMKAESSLLNYQSENVNLQSLVEGLRTEKEELVRELNDVKSRESTLKKELLSVSSPSSTSGNVPAPSETSDPLYQKFKKVVANYKLKSKLCQELESKLENVRKELADKDKLINCLSNEEQQLQDLLSSSNSRINQLQQVIEIKTNKIKELILVIERICKIETGVIDAEVNSTVLNVIVEKWISTNEANIQMVHQQMSQMNSVLSNVNKLEGELEELKVSLKGKDDTISELEEEREKLSDVVKCNEKELELLRAMYEKVSEKNEHFYTDLMSIEKEMADGKTELLSRLEVVTQNYDRCLTNLQERENYIETLEQDIITMKSKMYNIESGMDERHRVLKETSDQLMAKFQAAEIMSQTFEKYKTEVESKIESLEREKQKAEENERRLKEFVSQLEKDKEVLIGENDKYKVRVEDLVKEIDVTRTEMVGMCQELEHLRELKDAYNNTLDKIEELNVELTQTTVSFEVKNQRLEMLEQERMELVNKLSDVEDACAEFEGKYLEEAERSSALQNEINLKDQSLDMLQQEKLEFLNRIGRFEKSISELEGKLVESKDVNNNLLVEMEQKNQRIIDLEKETNELSKKFGYCEELNSKAQEYIEQVKSAVNELTNKEKLLSGANEKLFDLQTQLVEAEMLCASVQDELPKTSGSGSYQWMDIAAPSVAGEEVDKCVMVAAEKGETANIVSPGAARSNVHVTAETKPETASMSVFTWSDQGASSPPDNPFVDIKDEEDGWGWMAQEATLEHDHKHSEAVKIQELSNKLIKITEERDEYLNELTATKTKCQKLMKKIKEIKILNENLERSKSNVNVGFSDLDFVVQEELRAENDKLQAKINELSSQYALLKNEKDLMTQRLDTLVSANEHLVDLKERQDLEVQMWQKKSNQLMNEVKGLKLSVETKEGNLSDEMANKLTTLINENDELKLLLEAKKRELEAKTNEIDLELPEKFDALTYENEELTTMLNTMKHGHEVKLKELMQKLSTTVAEKETLLQEIAQKDQQLQEISLKFNQNLQNQYNALSIELENTKSLLRGKEQEVVEAQHKYGELVKQHSSLAEKILQDAELKEQQLREVSMKRQQEFQAQYNTLSIELENYKTLLREKENELVEVRQILHQKSDTHNLVDNYQQTEEVINVPKNEKEEEHPVVSSGGDLKVFSFGGDKTDVREDLFQVKNVQFNRELEMMTIRLQTVTEEKLGLENYVKQLENEIQHLKDGENEILLKVEKDRETLSAYLEEAKREVLIWKQKVEELLKELESKEEIYYCALKEKDDKYQHNLLAKDEENAHLVCSLSAKEQSLKEVTNQLHLLKNELENLNTRCSNEKKVLEDVIQRLNVELSLSNERLSDVDISKNYNDQVSQLQTRLDEVVKEYQRKDGELELLKQQFSSIEEEFSNRVPAERLGLVEQEKFMLESLLREREVEVDSLKHELTTLMKRKDVDEPAQLNEDVLNSMQDKDNEIGRLTKTVVEMQERLLRMEEGRMLAKINDLQNKYDKALHIVYLRDVKIEELTQEIVQLLEERDTLQFRLAEALRTINTFSRNRDDNMSNPVSPPHQSTNNQPPSSSPVNEKLNKIRNEYRKDPAVQIESESRHLQHMQLYSSHEEKSAAEEIISTPADYGIFNWFFGGSSSSPSSSPHTLQNPKEDT